MGWLDNLKHWTDGGLGVAREIDNLKHWTDGGLEVAREIAGIHQRPNRGSGYTRRGLSTLHNCIL